MFDSTSADSDGELFSSEEDVNTQSSPKVVLEPEQLSLILKKDPGNSMTLLMYLKSYSELLHGWGEIQMAAQTCKLISNTCHILLEYHSVNIIDDMPFILSDYTLFSDYTLNYLLVELHEIKA